MKNKEKFRFEIKESIKAGGEVMCSFLKDFVIPRFVSEEAVEVDCCGNLECYTCSQMFSFWLDEEYIEPPKPEVDWSKVTVDTLVQVRDDENDKWTLRYFKWFVRGHCTPFVTWADGATRKTAEDCTEYWRYCELAEDAADCNEATEGEWRIEKTKGNRNG